MPKPGFKTITVAEAVFDKFYAKYEADKEDYKEKGIFSFAGYITKILLDTKEQDQLKNVTEMQIITNSLLIGMFEHMLGGSKESAITGLESLKYVMMDFIREFKGNRE